MLRVFVLCLLFASLAYSYEKIEYKHPLASLGADPVSCLDCTARVDIVRKLLFSNATENTIVKVIVDSCVEFRIQNASVCEGIIPLFKDEFFFVLRSGLSTRDICGFFLGSCPYPVTPRYNVTFPKPKPPHVAPVPPAAGSPRSSILQISDLHYDELYVPGMTNDCGQPLCCRAFDGRGQGSKAAGAWGDYECDLSPAMLSNAMQHWQSLSNKPDFVFWTGDNPPHDVWLQTREGQIANSAQLAKTLQEAFGSIPVFPCIGNHESVPVNSYPVPPLNAWLYDALATQWSVWLPESALKTFRYGGYYVAPLKPGFQVVSLNMNYCNNGNGWLLLNSSDPGQMLEWFIQVLQTAEDSKDKIYVIGHIPPGVTDCVEHWGTQFYEIINRYEDTIIASFFGHTHADEFEVFYEGAGKTKRPTTVAYIAPSVTTYKHYNPSYRIYTTESSSGYITETSTYHVNLTDANLVGTPKWVLGYNASTTYNLTNFFAPAWDNLVDRLEKETPLFDQYYFYRSSSANPDNTCNAKCKKTELCRLRSANSELLRACTSIFGATMEEINKYKSC